MTSLFPHPPYAEDQPYARTILYLHTFRAGAMTGSFIPIFTAPIAVYLSSRNAAPRNPNPRTPLSVQLLQRHLVHSSRGLVAGGIFGLVATAGRMYGREEIEWKDRSWRLLQNRGQEVTDLVAFGGAGLGAVVGGMVARSRVGGIGGVRAVLGGTGVGMSFGVLYMMVTFARGRGPA
ncbi:hypothetical protein CC80DRAFT_521992 [Byssothecium circinans]|uniref:Uncharacterized protein n=1 Tax=Byssothecium circinans TaxID=147558 RepID=A0A6A5UHC8_9PLEO|nr:hypothetical protein CC80DRAFT_521992 [Byssothecium circinans]